MLEEREYKFKHFHPSDIFVTTTVNLKLKLKKGGGCPTCDG